MPGAVTLRIQAAGSARPEIADLRLPSSTLISIGAPTPSPQLVALEIWLREGLMNEAIAALCRHLRTRSQHAVWKLSNVRGVVDNTRSLSSFKALQVLIEQAKAAYRYSHRAMSVLHGDQDGQPGPWTKRFPILEDKDVRGQNTDEPTEDELAASMTARLQALSINAINTDRAEPSDITFDEEVQLDPDTVVINRLLAPVTLGQRERLGMSWIWTHGAVDVEDDETFVEWAKARARCRRWHKEVQLLVEEMQRVLDFTQYEMERWIRLGEEVNGDSVGDMAAAEKERRKEYERPGEAAWLMAARQAFAAERAACEDRYRRHLVKEWRPVLLEAQASDLVDNLLIPDDIVSGVLPTSNRFTSWSWTLTGDSPAPSA
jgi:hypothetical protein